jgi:hypothetical protein
MTTILSPHSGVSGATEPSSSQRQRRIALTGILSVLLALASAVLLSPAAQAQVYGGSLTGIATDPSGAVVPGAKVVLTDADKGFKYTATTDS